MDFQLIAAPPLYFQVALNLGETASLISLKCNTYTMSCQKCSSYRDFEAALFP